MQTGRNRTVREAEHKEMEGRSRLRQVTGTRGGVTHEGGKLTEEKRLELNSETLVNMMEYRWRNGIM